MLMPPCSRSVESFDGIFTVKSSEHREKHNFLVQERKKKLTFLIFDEK